MRSKKLFAIISLVAIMMTLVPAFTFGVVPGYDRNYSSSKSTVSITRTSPNTLATIAPSAQWTKEDAAKVTITFKTSTGADVAGRVYFAVKSTQVDQTGWVDNAIAGEYNGSYDVTDTLLDGEQMGSKDGMVVSAVPDADSKVYLYVGSVTSSTFKLSIYNDLGADSGAQIDDTIATVTVKNDEGDITLSAKNDDEGSIDALDTPTDVDASFTGYTAVLPTMYAGDGIEVVATLKDGGSAIEDASINFKYTLDGGTKKSLGTDTTDGDGEASFYFTPEETGMYRFYATGPDGADSPTLAANVMTVKFVADSADVLEAKTADGTKIAVDKDTDIDFNVKDKYGNKAADCDYREKDADHDIAGTGVAFEVTAAPSGSSLDGETYTSGIDDGVATLANFQPDELGKYTIEAKLANDTRTRKTITVEAVKFGTVKSLTVALENTDDDAISGLVYGVNTSKLAIKVVDENGVALAYDDADDAEVKVAVSNKDAVSVDGSFNIRVLKEADDFLGAVSFTVVDVESGVSAKLDTEVVGAPNGLKADATVTEKAASVNLQYVDKNGKATYDGAASGAFTVVTPAGVYAKSLEKFDKTGKASFKLTADEAGTYNITVITDNNLAETFEVAFSANGTVKPGTGKSVVMFIGATAYVQDGTPKTTDVAPFIKDGRTFVAIRPIADAFGATIAWDAATQTVTLTKDKMTVTVVIGSNEVKVVKDGVESKVTADVPAMIQDGRTVLPFRAVGDAFGATVNYDQTTQSVSYTF